MIDGRCEYNLPRLALKSECCCSVGVAWGSPCELCDHSVCECSKGYAKFGGKDCVDVNECELNSGICKGGGTCVNTDGSYRCECPPGLTLDASRELRRAKILLHFYLQENITLETNFNLQCSNFKRQCKTNLKLFLFFIFFLNSILEPSVCLDTTCIDTRQETCYLDYRHGQCANPIDGQFSKSLCCCSVGRAWGSERCESCPKPGSHAHQELCPRGTGFTDRQDINECIEFPGMCLNGRCKNTVGTFSCKCNQGFALDEHGIKCNGEYTTEKYCANDCQFYRERIPVCDVSNFVICTDIDECEIMHGVCGNGTCRNTPGNFQCDCNPGYRSSDIMKICMGT